MTNLASLNDYCLLKIIGYLIHRDQVSLWSLEPTSRLGLLISSIWQRWRVISVTSRSFGDRHPDVLKEYLNFIAPFAVELFVMDLTMEQLELFRQFTFPRVRAIQYSGKVDHEGDLELLGECCPLVTSFELRSKPHGTRISQWANLRCLGLRNHFRLPYFGQLCQKLTQLQSLGLQGYMELQDSQIDIIGSLTELQELTINIFEISERNIARLMRLPKMRKLRVYCLMTKPREVLFAEMRRLRQEDVVAVVLKELNYPSYRLSGRQLCSTFQGFPRLQSLHLNSCSIRTDEANMTVWDVVAALCQLKQFGISNVSLEEDFFAFSESQMHKALQGRTEPLTFHFHQTKPKKRILRTFNHPKAKVSFQSLGPWGRSFFTWNYTDPYVEVELTPLVSTS